MTIFITTILKTFLGKLFICLIIDFLSGFILFFHLEYIPIISSFSLTLHVGFYALNKTTITTSLKEAAM